MYLLISSEHCTVSLDLNLLSFVLCLIASQITYQMLLTNSTVSAPPTSSAEAILHHVFRSLARYSGLGVHNGDQSLCAGVGFQLLMLLFNQIQQDDLSAAWPSFLTAVLLCLPVTPGAANSHHTDCAENPLQPISTVESSMFSNLILYTLTGVIIFRSFFHWPPRIFLSMELSTRGLWSSSSALTKPPCQAWG